MPRAKRKAVNKASSRVTKKKIKTEFEDKLAGIGLDGPVVDLTGDKKPISSKGKTKPKVEKKASEKKQVSTNKKEITAKEKAPPKVFKDDPWSNDDDADLLDSDASDDWFEKFFTDKKPKKKQNLSKSTVEKKVEAEKVAVKVVRPPAFKTFRWTDDEDEPDEPKTMQNLSKSPVKKKVEPEKEKVAVKVVRPSVSKTFRWTDDEDEPDEPKTMQNLSKSPVKKKVEPGKEKDAVKVSGEKKVEPEKVAVKVVRPAVSKSFSWTDDEDNLESDASEDSFDKHFPKEKEREEKSKSKRKHTKLEYSMVQHIPDFEVEHRIFCSICNIHLNQMPGHPQNYSDHVINVHAKAVGDDRYLCTYCNNDKPKNLKTFKVHLFRHRKMAKPKQCPACSETFTDYNKWRCHMRMEKSSVGKHPNKRIFACEACGKMFGSNNSLQMHVINIHEKKGRKCRWCPLIIPYDEWEEHKQMEKIKNKVKVDCVCDICGAQFTSKDSAANHRRNFHRNVDLECSICHKRGFNSSTRLSQHKTMNHAEKRFQCAYCLYKHSYKYVVTQHIRSKHKLKKEDIPDDAIIEHKPTSSIPEIRDWPVSKKTKEKMETPDFPTMLKEYDSDSIY